MRRYTDKEMRDILKNLRIRFEEGFLSSEDMAEVWTWRVKEERDVEHRYTSGSVRKRVADKTLTPLNPGEPRLKFAIADAFYTPLYPKRNTRSKENSTSK